jgi:hypothetical protein
VIALVLCHENIWADEPRQGDNKEHAANGPGSRKLPRRLLVSTAADVSAKPVAITHPLDPLSAAEMAEAVKLLRASNKLGPGFRFVSCTLEGHFIFPIEHNDLYGLPVPLPAATQRGSLERHRPYTSRSPWALTAASKA